MGCSVSLVPDPVASLVADPTAERQADPSASVLPVLPASLVADPSGSLAPVATASYRPCADFEPEPSCVLVFGLDNLVFPIIARSSFTMEFTTVEAVGFYWRFRVETAIGSGVFGPFSSWLLKSSGYYTFHASFFADAPPSTPDMTGGKKTQFQLKLFNAAATEEIWPNCGDSVYQITMAPNKVDPGTYDGVIHITDGDP